MYSVRLASTGIEMPYLCSLGAFGGRAGGRGGPCKVAGEAAGRLPQAGGCLGPAIGGEGGAQALSVQSPLP